MLRPLVVRLDARYEALTLIMWIHTVLGAWAAIPWNSKWRKRWRGVPPSWAAQELATRSSIERFFGRVLVYFRL
jgi:hypothetical protein